ncbi:MAG: flagellar export protein FliJ [Oscillospiraceae bacterium]|nr:flagellar export protein FliJ [Oscillospiraceae bacterium]
MKKFKFNLESVLKYRESSERQEKGVLSVMNAQLNGLLDELAKLNSDYGGTARELEEASGGGISIMEIRSKYAILENIAFYIAKKTEEIEEQKRHISRQTAVVTRAMRATKTMDRLKELRYKEYVKNENREQEKFIEEFVSQRQMSKKTI